VAQALQLGVSPPTESAAGFVRWMAENRGEDPDTCVARYERYPDMVGHVDLWEARTSARSSDAARRILHACDRGVIYPLNYHRSATE